jgi:hypothetical protein
VEFPVACSLSEAGARAQVGEWRRLIATSVSAAYWVSPTELALCLHADLAGLAALTRLAQREKACCPFLGLSIQIEPDSVALHVSAPEGAATLLHEFARFAEPKA